MTPAQVAKLAKDRAITSVRVGTCDADGVLKGKRVSIEAFLRGAESGFNQSDSIFSTDLAGRLIEGLESGGWQSGFPNLVLKPDLATFQVLPWESGGAWVVADVATSDGKTVDLAPRAALKNVVAELRKIGHVPHAAFELGVRIYRETSATLREKAWADLATVNPSRPGHALVAASEAESVILRIRHALEAAGVPVETWHRGHDAGSSEFSLRPAEALPAADRAALFKAGTKEVCLADGLLASFMARASRDRMGLGGHVNVSLWDAKNTKNLFAAEGKAKERGPLSDIGRQFLAGVLATLPDFTVLHAPNVNSYKRFFPGGFAPTSVTWGVENRSCALRVTSSGGAAATRIENRVPGADANPYLALAATLGGGLHGLREKLELPPSLMGSAYDAPERAAPRLPRSLLDATELFEKSDVAKKLFGESFVRYYARTRRAEWDQYLRDVSAWERERYLEAV